MIASMRDNLMPSINIFAAYSMITDAITTHVYCTALSALGTKLLIQWMKFNFTTYFQKQLHKPPSQSFTFFFVMGKYGVVWALAETLAKSLGKATSDLKVCWYSAFKRQTQWDWICRHIFTNSSKIGTIRYLCLSKTHLSHQNFPPGLSVCILWGYMGMRQDRILAPLVFLQYLLQYISQIWSSCNIFLKPVPILIYFSNNAHEGIICLYCPLQTLYRRSIVQCIF